MARRQIASTFPRPERIYWLRRTVPGVPRINRLPVTVGLMSESYEVFANGVQIGDTGDFGKPEVNFFQPRSFALPPEAIRPGLPLVISLSTSNAGAKWGSLTTGFEHRSPYQIIRQPPAGHIVGADHSPLGDYRRLIIGVGRGKSRLAR